MTFINKGKMKRIINICISILLMMPFLSGMVTPLEAGNDLFSFFQTSQFGFQKLCDTMPCNGMTSCTPHIPKCPHCPFSNCIDHYFRNEVGIHLPLPSSPFILLSASTLSDQEFVKSIFRPPMLTI